MSHASPGKLFKNTILLYFRLILTLGVSLYTSRVVINALGIENYGIYNVVAGTVTLIAFLNSAMSASTQRFLSYEIGKGHLAETSDVFNTAIYIHVGIAGIIFIAGQIVGNWLVNHVLTIPPDRLAAANWVLQCAIISLMVNVIQAPYTAVILSRERMDVYAYMSFVDVGAKLAIVFMLGIGAFDPLKLYASLQLSTAVLVASIYGLYCHRSFAECRLSGGFSWQRVREMGSFVCWNLFANITSVLNTQGINILLNIYFGPAINAARGVAVQASGTLQGFVGSVQAASAPQIVKTYSAGQIAEEIKLILFACKITLLLLFLMAFPVFLETDEVLRLWLGNPPANAALFLKLILINAMITTSANPMYHAIMATGRIKWYQSICAVVLLIGVSFGWLLLNSGAPAYVVFLITIGVSVVFFGMQLRFLKNAIGFSLVSHFKGVILPALKVISAGALFPLLVRYNMPEGSLRLLLVTGTTFTLTPLLILWLGLQKNEADFLKTKLLSYTSRRTGDA